MSNKALSMEKPIVHLDTSRPLTPDERQRIKDECRLMYGNRYTVILHAPNKAQYDEYMKEVVRRYEQGQQDGKNGIEWLKECCQTTPLKRTARRLL